MTANDESRVVLRHTDGGFETGIRRATERPSGFDIGGLLSNTGLATYDPGFGNTAAVCSAITYIDGDAGILRYRGYPIEQRPGRPPAWVG